MDAMRSSNDGERTVICYICVEGYQYGETAKFLKNPPGTVASRVYHGRRRLREALASASPSREPVVSVDVSR